MIGEGVTTAAPGSLEGLRVVVADIAAARSLRQSRREHLAAAATEARLARTYLRTAEVPSSDSPSDMQASNGNGTNFAAFVPGSSTSTPWALVGWHSDGL